MYLVHIYEHDEENDIHTNIHHVHDIMHLITCTHLNQSTIGNIYD